VIHRHYAHVGSRTESIIDELTLDVIRAPWTCKSGEMSWPKDMAPLFVWQSGWSCRRNVQLQGLGPEDCRRCKYWEFESSL
jgi:hypothetical protein